MNETLEAPSAPPLSATAIALEHCVNVYRQVYSAAQADGKGGIGCSMAAAAAYRRVLPPADSIGNIQALIACIIQGINMEVYHRRESTQLLYAAQVAITAHRSPGRQA